MFKNMFTRDGSVFGGKKYLLLFVLALGCFLFLPGKTNAAYDLEVTGMSVNPSNPRLNVESEITITVKNNDVEDLVDLTGINSYIMDFRNFELISVTLPDITPYKPIVYGKTFKYIIKGLFNELGSARLNFNVNPYEDLPERTLANNDRYIDVTVVPAHDLVVTSVESVMTGLREGQETTIIVKVQNNGYHNLLNNLGISSYYYSFEDFVEKSKIIPKISLDSTILKKEYVEYSFTGYFNKIGEKKLYFIVDRDDQLNEFNENNNDMGNTVVVGSEDDIDIKASDIILNKNEDKYIVGDVITVKLILNNSGKISLLDNKGLLERDYGYASGGDLLYDFPGIEITNIEHPVYPEKDSPLNPGKNLNYTFSGEVKEAGVHTLKIDIDIHNDLLESDESNNTITKVITVYKSLDDMYDFNISSIKCDSMSSTSLRISWYTNKENDGYVMYRDKSFSVFDRYMLKNEIKKWPAADDTKEHAVVLSNLIPNTEYLYEIRAKNYTVEKKEGVFNCFTPKNDQIKISNINQNIDHKNKKIVISWETDILTRGHVYYKKKNADKYLSKEEGKGFLQNHSVTVDGLLLGDYEFYVYSKADSLANEKSSVFLFTILDSSSLSSEQKQSQDQGKTQTGSEVKTSTQEQTKLVFQVNNQGLYSNLRGRIVLKVEAAGEAYYVDPISQNMYYLGRPNDAFVVMRERGIGITNNDLYKIPVGVVAGGVDSDGDGLSDDLERALSLDPGKKDTDGDGHEDKNELINGFSPWGGGKQNIDNNFTNKQKGKILLQVEKNGEAWYVSSKDGRRYFLGRPTDAFAVMRNLGLGISNSNFDALLN